MSEQYWGVCFGDDESIWEIQAVYKSHDYALQEAMVWTRKTQVQHVVKPVNIFGEMIHELPFANNEIIHLKEEQS